MPEKDVHHPSLPGVKTFEKDANEKAGFVDVDGVVLQATPSDNKMKIPEKGVVEQVQKKSSNNSILTNKDDVFDVSGAFEGNPEQGTIVTDKRKKRRRLGRALKEAFIEWSNDTMKTVRKTDLFKKRVEPKIEPAASRVDVIQEATKKSVHAPQDDHEVVVEKLRTLSNDAKEITGKPYILKKKPKVSAATWEHPDDNKESTNPAPHIPIRRGDIAPEAHQTFVAPTVTARSEFVATQPKEPEIKKEATGIGKAARKDVAPSATSAKELKEEKTKSRWSFLVKNTDIEEEEEDGPQKTPTQIQPAAKSQITKATIPPRPPVPKPAPILRPTPPPTPPVPVVTPPPPPPVAPPTAPPAPVPPTPQLQVDPPVPAPIPTVAATPAQPPVSPLQSAPNMRPIQIQQIVTAPKVSLLQRITKRFVLIAIVFAAVVGGIGTGVYLFTNRDSGTTGVNPVVSTIPAFVRTDARVPVSFSDDRDVLLETITSEVEAASARTTQIYPTYSAGDISDESLNTPATAANIFAIIEPRAPGAFIRSLEDRMMFGAIKANENEPFMILRSNVFDVAFAGMLSWEQFMAADLAPLFGAPVARSFDANARTADQTLPARFVDTTVNNKSVRILYDETGTARITYSFVNRNTIVITSTPEAMTALIQLIQ